MCRKGRKGGNGSSNGHLAKLTVADLSRNGNLKWVDQFTRAVNKAKREKNAKKQTGQYRQASNMFNARFGRELDASQLKTAAAALLQLRGYYSGKFPVQRGHEVSFQANTLMCISAERR